MPIDRKCKTCKGTFTVSPSRKNANFCSRKCFAKWYVGENNKTWKPKIKKVCDLCGKLFEVKPSSKNAKYCSHECYWKSKKGKEIRWSREKVIKELVLLEKKLGYTPRMRVYTSLANACRHYLGTWNNALKEAGIEVTRERGNFSKEDVGEEMLQVMREIGTITRPKLQKIGNNRLIVKIQKTFGSIKKAREYIGMEHPEQYWNKEKVLSELEKISRDIGHSPTFEELNRINCGLTHACMRYFSSFNNAKKKINLSINEADTHIQFLQCDDGHIVKSSREREIDNWLFHNGVLHQYERNMGYGNYKCDFFIPNANVWIEYWGLSGRKEYDLAIKKKHELYHRLKLNLVYIYPRDNIADKLKFLLAYSRDLVTLDKFTRR